MIHLDAETHDGVVTLTIDRQDRRNALDRATLVDIHDAIAALDDRTRVLVLTGAGGHFSAGADLSAVKDDQFAGVLRRTLDLIAARPYPVVAAIEGSCMGLGMQLAVTADLRVASADARFAVPAARIGVLTDHWTVRRLSTCAGDSVARGMLLGAQVYSGEELHGAGFVHRLGGLADAHAWAREITRLAPLTLQAFKFGLNALEPHIDDPDYVGAFSRVWSSEDLREGIRAFHARDRPEFHGR